MMNKFYKNKLILLDGTFNIIKSLIYNCRYFISVRLLAYNIYALLSGDAIFKLITLRYCINYVGICCVFFNNAFLYFDLNLF